MSSDSSRWFDYCYDRRELLTKLHSFKADHALIRDKKALESVFSPFALKAFMLGWLLFMFAYQLATTEFRLVIAQMTNWALTLTIIHLGCSLYCSMDTHGSLSVLALHHITFEMIVPMNMLVTVVYWVVLREVALATYANTPITEYHSTAVHLFPLIFTGLNFAITNIVIKPSHGLSLFAVGFVYGVNNYK